MQDWPLTLDRIIDHAAGRHGDREIVWRDEHGSCQSTNYRKIRERARQVGHGLSECGIEPGDRVATLAWNDARHVEIWYGAMGIGAVCHTLNPRLHPQQLGWIMAHAGDRVIFVAKDLLQLLEAAIAANGMPSPTIIVLGTDDDKPSVLSYEKWLRSRPTETADGCPEWGQFPETAACGLCYTSGTTGDPKGVLYSHRSNFLHTYITLQPDVFGLRTQDVVLPIVPMFHANAWGLVFSAPAAGSKLVLPGKQLDPTSLHELIVSEGVTFAAGVPTVWQGLLQHLRETGGSLAPLQRVVIGGAASSEGIVRELHDEHGVDVRLVWGMTEVSPLGTASTPPARLADAPFEQQLQARMKQGRPPLGVQVRIAADDGTVLPEDGRTPGRLLVRGAAVLREYFSGSGSVLDEDGFFDTGDIATIDSDGAIEITDRAKDIIKSGGEWISSIALEKVACAHPQVVRAAAIGVPDPHWGERPLLLVQTDRSQKLIYAELEAMFHAQVPKWWMPTIQIVAEIPLGPTGKIDKKILRQDQLRGASSTKG